MTPTQEAMVKRFEQDAYSDRSNMVEALLESYRNEHTAHSQVDVPLLRKTFEWVQTEAQRPSFKSEWNQTTWRTEKQSENFCHTAYCIAGKVLTESDDFTIQMLPSPMSSNERYGATVTNNRTGEQIPFAFAGAAELGIEQEEANLLFYGENSLGDVRVICEVIMERAGDRL